jgi:hypothetical protein
MKMSEPKKPVAVPAALPGANAATGANGSVASAKPDAQPAAPSAPVAVAQPVKAALFGGHKGGGKKREDGLVAGSPAAIEADKKKNAERMRNNRAAKKAAEIPAALPSLAAAAANAPAAVPAAESAVAGAAGSVAAVPGVVVAPLFVPWSEKVLMRITKTVMRIVDRVRCSSLMLRIKKLRLTTAQEKEVEQKIQFKAAAVEDFNVALANCATIELNKRRVPGAEHSHWLDVVITGGELANSHLDTIAMLEKMMVENEFKRQGMEAPKL